MPSLPQDDSNRCTWIFFLLAELAFEDVFFFDCFFLTVFFGAIACLSLADFFARFEVAVFDFVCLLLAFFLLEGMAAVYHRNQPAAATPPRSKALGAMALPQAKQTMDPSASGVLVAFNFRHAG